jgi:hypothetical protein
MWRNDRMLQASIHKCAREKPPEQVHEAVARGNHNYEGSKSNGNRAGLYHEVQKDVRACWSSRGFCVVHGREKGAKNNRTVQPLII